MTWQHKESGHQHTLVLTNLVIILEYSDFSTRGVNNSGAETGIFQADYDDYMYHCCWCPGSLCHQVISRWMMMSMMDGDNGLWWNIVMMMDVNNRSWWWWVMMMIMMEGCRVMVPDDEWRDGEKGNNLSINFDEVQITLRRTYLCLWLPCFNI